MAVGARQLTREGIAAAALALIDRDGLDAFSMRRLADELGIGTMTLYGYFGGRGELLDAVTDAVPSSVPAAAATGSWRERATLIACTARRNLEAHPALVQIRLRGRIVRPQQFRVTEANMRALIDAGLPPAEAARAFRLLFTYVFGFVAFSPTATADDARRDVRTGLAALPPEEYPLLSSMIDEASEAAAGDEQFEYGLDRILDGIEARVAALP